MLDLSEIKQRKAENFSRTATKVNPCLSIVTRGLKFDTHIVKTIISIATSDNNSPHWVIKYGVQEELDIRLPSCLS